MAADLGPLAAECAAGEEAGVAFGVAFENELLFSEGNTVFKNHNIHVFLLLLTH